MQPTEAKNETEVESDTEAPEADIQAHPTDSIDIFSANLALLVTDLFQIADKLPETTVLSLSLSLSPPTFLSFF